VDRACKLQEEKAELASAISDIYKEAKSAGYNPKELRIVVKRRCETADQAEKRRITESNVELIEAALGSFVNSPLGQAAVERLRA